MNRAFIEDIITHLETEFPQLKKVDLFNNQIERAADGTGGALDFPAVFLSFPDGVNYNDFQARSQRTENLTVRLVIANRTTGTKAEKLSLFDLKESIYIKMAGFNACNSHNFSRIREEIEEDHDNTLVFIQDYTTIIEDSSAYMYRNHTGSNIGGIHVNTTVDNG